jgi:thioredoxin 1
MKKILYFSAPWCQPCKTFSPVMQQIATRLPVQKIDVDATPHLAKAFNVVSVPTVLIIKNELEAKRFTGVQSAHVIIEAFNTI